MKKNIKYIIILFCLGLMVGCQKDIYRFTHEFSIPQKSKELPLVQFIVDEEDYTSYIESANLNKALEYTKIPYKNIVLKEFNENQKLAPTARVLCIYDTTGFNDIAIDSLLSFVAKGGTLYFTKAIRDERLSFLIGLNPDANWELDKSARGYYFNSPIFPGKQGLEIENIYQHIGLVKRNFSDKVNVLVSASNSRDFPILLENKIGKGRVLLNNSNIVFSKTLRGLMFATVLKGLEGVPYPIANVATIFLDDFPSPTYNIYKEPIKSELNITISEYVKDVWWPDMKRFAQQENIKYTAYLTFDYNEQIVPPFDFNEWDRNTFKKDNTIQEQSSWIARDVLESGHELGFHGYNHVSLLNSDWNNNPDYMTMALNTANKKWKILNLKDAPISYVPPSNNIDSIGISRLQQAMPSIKFMQSVFHGDKEGGGGREFDPEPYNSKLFDYPRISSGYFLKSINEWNIESLYVYTGIWTHFVHPDDVYQIPSKTNAKTSGNYAYRNPNNLNWYSKNGKKGLFDIFKSHISDYKERHPFSRFLDATKSSEITMNWRYSYYKHATFDGNYEVESNNARNKDNNNYWLMYVDSKNSKTIDNSLLQEALEVKKTPILDGYLYSIKTPKPIISIPNLYTQSINSGKSEGVIIADVRKEYELFLKNKDLMTPLADKLKRYVADGDLKKATDLIAPNILTNSSVNVPLWEEYAQYMSWQKKEKELWKDVDNYYNKYASKNAADLSRKINKIVAYQNIEESEKWLTRQIEWDTNDEETLNEYVDFFNTEDRKDVIKKVLNKLVVINPNKKNVTLYINHLITYEDDDLISELELIEPCDKKYKDFADVIAWAYADNLRFDKALLWYECSTINDPKTQEYWLLNSTSFERMKETNFPFYIALLLANNDKKAMKELKNIKTCSNSLQHLAKKIATLFADYGNFSKAIKWAECAENIKITDKLSWYYESNEITKLKKIYKEYIVLNTKDDETRMFMATLMMYSGDIKEAAKIAMSIPSHKVDASFTKMLNKEVLTLSLKDQTIIYRLYADLLDSETRKKIAKEIRMEQGNSIRFGSSSLNDKFIPTTLENIISYNIFNTAGDMHSFCGTQSIMYAIKSGPDNFDNIGRDLMGVEYIFSKKSIEKYKYSLRGRIERDNLSEVYFQAGASLSYNNKKKFTSFELNAFPVKSGPGHSLGIYRVQFTGYKEMPFAENFTQIVSLESNYYTDNQGEAIVLGQLQYKLVDNKMFKISPFIEGVYSKGSIDQLEGYPYWIADKRMYAGGGLLLNIGSERSKFNLRADFSKFSEYEQPNFERYTGNMSYKIKDYTKINFAYEVYTIENFFSNVIQFGLVYNFK